MIDISYHLTAVHFPVLWLPLSPDHDNQNKSLQFLEN
jgi:hypothetical protein